MKRNYIYFVFLMSVLTSVCYAAPDNNSLFIVTKANEVRGDIDKVLIIQPLLLQKVFKIESFEEQFQKNLLIGRIKFDKPSLIENVSISTGDVPVGEHVSVSYTYTFPEIKGAKILLQEEFERKAKEHLMAMLQKNLQVKGYTVVLTQEAGNEPESDLFPPVKAIRAEPRGIKKIFPSPKEDYDNQSTEKYDYNTVLLWPDQADKLKGRYPENRFILFAWIESFYSHNRGKFFKRKISADPGARAGVLVCLYDVQKNESIYFNYFSSRGRFFGLKLEIPEGKEDGAVSEAMQKAVEGCLEKLLKKY
ncbi:MAG: hypothetical protein EHM45_24575 [Desulfobacteraceae bacterium]|nr:MAG: hypothetical protein EHM45_24575 [Desulfobacteraceae bacterium]